jgi:hypothetical protein
MSRLTLHQGGQSFAMGVLCALGGFLTIGIGWQRASGADLLANQLAILAGALSGLALLGVGLMLIIGSSFARERTTLERVEENIRAERASRRS